MAKINMCVILHILFLVYRYQYFYYYSPKCVFFVIINIKQFIILNSTVSDKSPWYQSAQAKIIFESLAQIIC